MVTTCRRSTGKIRIFSIGLVGLLGMLTLCVSTQAHAQQMVSNAPNPSISGVITEIDVINGRMRIDSDLTSDSINASNYTVNLSKTLVTDSADKQYLVIKDLRPGQRVRVELTNNASANSNEVVARNIIVHSAQQNAEVYQPAQSNRSPENSRLMGVRGQAGFEGPIGAQGLAGPEGRMGNALAGTRGPAGPAGIAGEQGLDGPRGPSGDLFRGEAGERGPNGSVGAQGPQGMIGKQGGSSAGLVGPAGVAGPQGARGVTGDMGIKGNALYGPSGQAGPAGMTGRQGIAGEQGTVGSMADGVAGLAGPAGPAGSRGPKGEAGPQGVTGRVGHWEMYKEFTFTSDQTALNSEDMKKVNEIQHYLKQNPSLKIGIDGTAVRSSNQAQNNLRVNEIKTALMDAGIDADRIQTDNVVVRGSRREGSIPVFFSTIE